MSGVLSGERTTEKGGREVGLGENSMPILTKLGVGITIETPLKSTGIGCTSGWEQGGMEQCFEL